MTTEQMLTRLLKSENHLIRRKAESILSGETSIENEKRFAGGFLTAVLNGNYEEALKNADQMASIRPDLRSYSRVSYMREIHGDRDGAKQAMKMAGDAGAFGQTAGNVD